MRARALALTLLAGIAFGACNAVAGKGPAEQAVAQFHERLDAAAYEEIYDDVDDQFKKATSRDQFIKVLRAIHEKLGKIVSSTQTNWYAQDRAGTGAGSYVTFAYDTQFASGRGTEQFNWRVDGGKPRLVGYNINSPDLIAK